MNRVVYTREVASASLLGKLLAAVLVPTVVTFAGFSLVSHHQAQRALEAELGRRLTGLAAVLAAQIPQNSVAVLAPGDEDSRTYHNLHRRLSELQQASGAARVYLFAADHTLRVDTGGEPIGARAYQLELSRAELRQVFGGQPASSLLFLGKDGRYYKSGYAPVPGDGQRLAGTGPQFAVGVDGSAELYRDLLDLRRTLMLLGGAGVLAMILLAVALGRQMSGPLWLLTESARGIGQGALDQPVPAAALTGRDEVAVLGRGLEAMRQALRARDERLQMMLSGIAHEVRNPLGGMELFAGLLREELAAPAPDLTAAAGYAERITREIGHLKAVVSDFLEYARRPRPDLAQVEIGPLLQEVVECAQAGAPPGMTVSMEAPPGLRALLDPQQLRRALLNLAHNAVQACASSPHGQVWLRARQPSGATSIAITVSDNGPGIPPDVLPRIWTPFFTTRQQGTGLGLAFVRDIMADHRGQALVDTGPAGTTFTVVLEQAPGA